MNPHPARALRAALAALACAAGLAAAPAPAAAAGPCGSTPGLVCSTVVVPLDRTGSVPGTIALHVETLAPQGIPRGTIFLVAGGPGQGSAHSFDLGSASSAEFYRFLFPGYTLVAYDDRGTGGSGLLGCPMLHTQDPFADDAQLVADCAALIGPGRSFYSTADHAEDLEAVRQSLGVDRVAIWGVSYGTKLALAYAAAHPTHVERLLLDSVVAPSLHDPFHTDVLQAMPSTLAAYCAGGSCRAATPDFPGDVVAVASALAAKPLDGRVPGRASAVHVDASDFLGLVIDADLNPGLAAELPAAVRSARAGRTQPLLHAYAAVELQDTADVDLSEALYLATVCRDGPFPWTPGTPVADRPALVKAAVAALPAGAFGPFGTWAEQLSDVELCLRWPTPAGGAASAAGPLPDVPVLALSGGLDLRTPTSGAASVVAGFPQGRLLVVPGVGHSVLTADPTGCSALAVRDWIMGAAPRTTCGQARPYLTTLGAFPAPGAKRLDPAQTLAVAAKTVQEAEAVWLMTAGMTGDATTTSGIAGGTVLAASRTVALAGYAITPGVIVSGALRLTRVGPPLAFNGRIAVKGARAAAGSLTVAGTTLGGVLGRKKVGR